MTPTRLKRALCLALACLGFAAMPASADPVDLSDPAHNSSFPHIAIDKNGNTTVGWGRANGPNAAMGSVSFRTPSSSAFSAPADLPPLANIPGKISTVRRIAVGTGGTVAVSTVNNNIKPARFQVAVRHPGESAFSQWINLSGANQLAHDGDLVVRANGDVVAVWKQDNGAKNVIQSSTVFRDGSVQAIKNVSAPSERNRDDGQVEVDINARGDVVATWTRSEETPRVYNRVQAATMPAGEDDFQPAKMVSGPNGSAKNPSVTVHPDGGSTVAWEQPGIFSTPANLNAKSGLHVATLRAGETGYGEFETLTPATESAHDAQILMDAIGRTTLVWSRAIPIDLVNGGTQVPDRLKFSSRAPGEKTWTAPQNISDGTASATEPFLADNAAGDVAVAWEERAERVKVARRSASAAGFSTPQTLSTGARERHPELAVGPDGDMTAVWVGFENNRGIIRTNGIDTTAPVIDAMNVPPTAAVGTAVPLSVLAHDRLSPITVRWELGDGATATGDSLTHTYTGLSTFTVKVTVTDAVGNTTSATRQIVIAPAPPAPPETKDGATAGKDGPAAPKNDATAGPAPRITRASLAPARFRAALRGGVLGRVRNPRFGTTLRFAASEAARVSIVLERRFTGRRVGGRCVLRRAGGRRCTSFRTVGSFASVSVRPGVVRLFPTGRFKGRRLALGSYRFKLQLTDPDGLKSRVATLTFSLRR